MFAYPRIDPVLLAFGPLKVHWYGMMYLLGFIAAFFLARRRCQREDSPITSGQIDDLILYAALGVVIGGRIGYVFFYGFDQLLADPLWLFRVWDGGMSFHGGFLGVLVAMALYARHIDRTFFHLTDFIAPLVPLGLGFGRLGNFINQELWGRPTDVPWAMVFPNDPLFLPRHPSQLYQFVLEGLLLFTVLYVFSQKPRPRYQVSALFLLGYGSLRFVVEFFRQPDDHIGLEWLGWMTRGQELCLPMIVAGAVLWRYSIRQMPAPLAIAAMPVPVVDDALVEAPAKKPRKRSPAKSETNTAAKKPAVKSSSTKTKPKVPVKTKSPAKTKPKPAAKKP